MSAGGYMKRTAGAMMLLAALGGCISNEHKPSTMDGNNPGGGNGPPTIPNAVGPWGQPVSYNAARAKGAASAPADGVVTAGYNGGIDNLKGTGTENGLVKANYIPPPPLASVAGQNGMGPASPMPAA